MKRDAKITRQIQYINTYSASKYFVVLYECLPVHNF